MADIAELGLKINTGTVDQAGAKLKNFGKIAGDTERKVIQSTNGMAVGFKSFNTSVKAAAPVVTTFEKTAKTATATGGNFANSIRQVSLQLSQVAQQGAVTGDFFRAFTVQLPDLLLPFGTLAILIGAVAGALGGPLIDALSGSSKAIKNIDEDIEELTDGFGELTDAQRAYVLLASEIKQSDLQKEFDDISQEVKAAADELKILEQGFRRTARGQRISIAADPEEIQAAELALRKLGAARDNISLKLDREIKLQKELKSSTDLTTRSALEAASSQRDSNLLGQLEATTEAIRVSGSTQSEIAIRSASERNSILAASYSQDLITFAEYQEQRVQNQLNLQNELTEIEKKSAAERGQLLTNEQQATIGASAQFFGNLASIAQAGGEDQFQEYKNLASAQAAIAASLAAIKALAEGGPILGPALAVSIGAVAAVQIAAINQQEYQGARAMGGQVSSGNSYLVGENGPEIVHMNGNGNVQANHNLGGGDNNVTVHVNIQSGVTKAELAGLLPSINQSVYNQVFAAINGGGTASQAVRRRA